MEMQPQAAPEMTSGDSIPQEQPMQQEAAPPQETTETMPQDDLRSRIEAEKEIYRQKQLMKKKEHELSEREQNLSKPKSVDDLLDDIINSKGEEGSAEEANQPLSEEEIIAKAKQEIFEELNQHQEEYEYEQQTHQAQEQFTHDVGDFISQNVESFPLAAELGLHNQISQEMVEQLQEIEEEYGEEYAEKWFNAVDWNEHIAQYENTLAENFKTMLKSDRVKNLLRSFLGEENTMPSGEPPKTLSRENFSGNSGLNRPLTEMTTEERVAYAKAQLRKQAQG